jgi:pullulanase
MTADIFVRKETAFVVWHATSVAEAPQLVIGQLEPGAPNTLTHTQRLALAPVQGFSDLWSIAAANCGLRNGVVYHYWFEVTASQPGKPASRLLITDPFATCIDWRIRAPRLDPPFTDDDRYPASVVKFENNRLVATDLNGSSFSNAGQPSPENLPPNNRLVIYELPTAWTRSSEVGGRDSGVGTFRDVLALIDANAEGQNFADLDITRVGRSYLIELGINALELLPPADSVYNRQWGYGTTNYSAPDFELGFPLTYSFPASNRDLATLTKACHAHGIRFFADVVMAFSKNNPYLAAACDDFFILNPQANPNDPDATNSRRTGLRDGFGASLFRYARLVPAYDPMSGEARNALYPARQFMKAALSRWMADFHIDGLRLDSVENVQNWDFVEDYKGTARALNRERFATQGAAIADARFLVVGEELTEPLALITTGRLDGLWHETFKRFIRDALIGRNHESEPTFEWTVRKAIDARLFGYEDLSQAVIYLTSHDVEGMANERLFNYLLNNRVREPGRRVKLAFACLLTAVGVPMILAGDEFADQHDLFDAKGNVTQDGGKQVDPVNFTRVTEPWRDEIKQYVARLIKLRSTYDALALNDTEFIHVDFNDGKRVLVWRRGAVGSDKQVVVVANFSDYGTANPFSPDAEYVVNNWPATPAGKTWREISQARAVLPEQVGREPIFPWEAKVYALV